MRNLLVAQSGGPTSAINATIAGVIMEAHASDQVDTIYGAVNGIKGVLEERFVNLSEKVPGEDELEILCQTPAAALGSCRVKLKNPAEDDSQFQEIIRIFRKHEIMYFIYAGGNDSIRGVMRYRCIPWRDRRASAIFDILKNVIWKKRRYLMRRFLRMK